MGYAFRIVNVFTVGAEPTLGPDGSVTRGDNDRLSGNPLCVFEDARGLTDAQMQALALQMNLSETTFVLPGNRVRIFTPTFEMPFAGHPTLGTASVIGGDRLVLEMKAGSVAVTRDGDRWTLRAAKPPATRAVEATNAELAAMVGLTEAAIAGTPLWVDTGVEQLVIPITSADHVRAARAVPHLIERHGFSATRKEAMAYLWAPDGTVRFFFTQHGAVIEDPATGSACANLGGYFIATGRALPVEMTLRQGDAVRRPSQLHLRVDADRGIHVAGSVIELGRGVLDL